MAFDQTKMGQVMAAQMEALEADYGDDCQIGDVCTIVEIVGPHGSHVRVRTSDARSHITLGLLGRAEATVLGTLRAGGTGDAEEDD